MVRLIFFCCLFTFFISSAYSKPIEIISKPDGIQLNISGIKFSKSELSSNHQKSKINIFGDNHIGMIENIGGYGLQTMNFLFAVPTGSNITADFSSMETMSLGKVNLPYYNEIYSEKKQKAETNSKSISPQASFEYLGNQRGIDIIRLTIQPFDYNSETQELSLIQSASIDVKFDRRVVYSDNKIESNVMSLFAAIDNPEILPGLLSEADAARKKEFKNRPQILDKPNWYSPNQQYYKVATTRDGIARLKISELLLVNPALAGLNSANIHLLFRGEEYPIYINDDDGVLNNSDEIYFMGKRASGDTTYLDNYTSDAVFYLFYDASSLGKRLDMLIQPDNTSNTIQTVNINKYLKKETDYHLGMLTTLTDTDYLEGWYWKFLNKYSGYNFYTNDFIIPSNNKNDYLTITAYFASLQDNKYGIFGVAPCNYDIYFIVNSDSVSELQFESNKMENLSRAFGINKLMTGMNRLELYSKFIDTVTDIYSNTGVDHFLISGKIQPFAYKGNFDFYTDSLTKDSKLTIPGFSSNFIFAIDTLKNIISIPKNIEQGQAITVSGESGKLPNASILLNDSAIASKEAGTHIVFISSNDFGVFNYRFFNSTSQGIGNLMDSIPQGSIIAGVYNDTASIVDEFKSKLKSAGSKIIDNHIPGQAYVFYYQKGSGSIVEQLSETIASINNFVPDNNGKSYRANFNLLKDSDYHLIINDANSLENAKISRVSVSDLRNPSNSAQALIISYKDFIPAAERLVVWRKNFQNINFKVIDVENVYKEYSDGKKSPHAIKDFLKYTYKNWAKAPTHLILFGDASWDGRKVRPKSVTTDYIPTFGNPVSDFWYGDLNDNYVPQVIVSRIPVTNLPQAQDYIDKLVEYDTIDVKPWMKRFMHISGPIYPEEYGPFCDFRYDAADYVTGVPLCGDTTSVCRSNAGGIISESEASFVRKKINEGTIWVNYVGHASANIYALDGWQVNTLNNFDKYSFYTTLACNAGAFAEAEVQSNAENYDLAKGKGFIGSAGCSSVSNVLVDEKIFQGMLKILADTSKHIRELGALVYAGKANLFKSVPQEANSYMQFNLLADPFTRLRISDKPDLYLLPNEIKVKGSSGKEILTEEDTIVTISGTIYNAGFCQNNPVKVTFEVESGNEKTTYEIEITSICNNTPFEIKIPTGKKPDAYTVRLSIDPEHKNIDDNWDNNNLVLNYNIFTTGIIALDPLPFWDVDAESPVFRLINPQASSDSLAYEFRLSTTEDTLATPIISSDSKNIEINESFIEWKPAIKLDNGKSYWLMNRIRNFSKEGKYSSWLQIPFNAKTNGGKRNTLWKQQTKNEFQLSTTNNIRITETSGEARVGLSESTQTFTVLGLTGIMSVGGNDSIKRWVDIEVNGKIYANSPFWRGFNVLAYSSLTGETKFKNFDTWEDTLSSVNLVHFLRDSVTDDDYILLATCDKSFRIPRDLNLHNISSIGSWDTLRAELNKFGSILIDSIDKLDTIDVGKFSFAMFGWRGANPGSIKEMYNKDGDTAIVQGSMTIFSPSGKYETNLIGPAKEWKDVRLTGKPKQLGVNYTTSIVGFKHLTNEQVILKSSTDITAFDLTDVSAKDYPYIKLNIEMNRNSRYVDPYFTNIDCNFVPAPEFTILQSKTALDRDSVMRGESVSLTTTIRNISRRTESDSNYLTTEIYPQQGDNISSLNIRALPPDDTTQLNYYIDTRKLGLENTISLSVDDLFNSNELYRFNNTYSERLLMYEDAIAPTIRLFADGVEIQNHDTIIDGRIIHNYPYVGVQPKFEIYIYDNSPLPIEDAKNLKVNLNSKIQTSETSTGYVLKLFPFADTSHLKAYITFIPDSLDFGLNYIWITARDATGNRDSLFLYLNVSLNGYITDLKNYPNPFNNETNFDFNYKGPSTEGNFNINIYNILGERIKKIISPIHIGNNVARWDAYDESGRSLPVGAYFYIITVDGYLYVDPVKGRCIISR